MTGFEPATSTSRTSRHWVPSDDLSNLTSTAAATCTAACTGEGKELNGCPAGDFAAALGMIATLPLSDAERADAVRRLLAGREGH
jgi:hypothetical protein